MYVLELLSCEEYLWQCSEGLFDSLETVRASIPDYTVEIVSTLSMTIVALPEYAKAVEEAYVQGGHYWWYDLDRHGQTEDYERPMFYGIQTRKVTTLEDL